MLISKLTALVCLHCKCSFVCLCVELAKGCYISAYRWNSGGVWKGRTWDQDLPNDSQVLYICCSVLMLRIFNTPQKLSVYFSFYDLANDSLKCVAMIVSNVTEPIDAFL